MPRAKLLSLWCALAVAVAAQGSGHAGPAEEYTGEIRPILEKACFDCHGPEKQKADLNLANYRDLDQVKGAPEVWQSVLERVQAFEMPPKGRPELDFSRHQKLMTWLRTLPRPDEVNCDQVASDRNTSFYKGYVMSRRLNRAEYRNTLRDLVGVDLPVDDLLPADAGGGEGFDTSGNVLFLSSIHIEKYLAAAERVLDQVLTPEPPQDITLAAARERILGQAAHLCRPDRSLARPVLERFARRAFRRPVLNDEIERLLALYDRAEARGDTFFDGIRLAFKGVLISPHFLFLAEPEPEAGGVHPLAAVPLASKLSYFLWSSLPDDELLALAENGDLLQDSVYRGQVRRLLADPRAATLGERFALQWLDLEKLGAEARPDAKRYPEFSDELARAMRQEVVDYFNHLVQANGSLLDLIDSDYTFANPALARLYGEDASPGTKTEQIRLSDHRRGGVTGMAAVHVVTSYPTRTSPVLRGRWILETLLGDKVPPPPADVPPLAETPAAGKPQTLRAQLELHRAKTECASCHDKMDPLGFSLENFDLIGRWREVDHGQLIDARGVLKSGQEFTGPNGLKKILLQRKDDVMRHLARKMAGFAFGRELNKYDECVVNRTVDALRTNEYRAPVLIEQIATSFPFRHRFYPRETQSVETAKAE